MRFTKTCAMALATMMLLTAGCGGGGDKKAADKGKAAGGGSKKLVMYWGALDDWMAKDIKEFEKDTGIKVEAVRMSSGEVIGRIKAEKANPKASIWFGGPADGQIQAKADGLWRNMFPPMPLRFPINSKIKKVIGLAFMLVI